MRRFFSMKLNYIELKLNGITTLNIFNYKSVRVTSVTASQKQQQH